MLRDRDAADTKLLNMELMLLDKPYASSSCSSNRPASQLNTDTFIRAINANGGDTQSRNLHKKLAQVSCASFLQQIFVQVLVQETFTTNMADKADRDAAAVAVAVIAVLAHKKLTSRKRKRNVWIKNENSGSDRQPTNQSSPF